MGGPWEGQSGLEKSCPTGQWGPLGGFYLRKCGMMFDHSQKKELYPIPLEDPWQLLPKVWGRAITSK